MGQTFDDLLSLAGATILLGAVFVFRDRLSERAYYISLVIYGVIALGLVSMRVYSFKAQDGYQFCWMDSLLIMDVILGLWGVIFGIMRLVTVDFNAVRVSQIQVPEMVSVVIHNPVEETEKLYALFPLDVECQRL